MKSSQLSTAQKVFDFAVVGLGAVGSAALYNLSKFTSSVVGIDRFDPPHILGSSHGETRITRLAVGEGEDYVALAKRSHLLWEEIERQSGQKLRVSCGGLLMDSGVKAWEKHGTEGFLNRTISFAQRGNIQHQVLKANEVKDNYPFFNLENSGKAYFEKEAGYLFPEKCIQAQLDLATRNGASIRRNLPILKIEEVEGVLKLDTANGPIFTKKALISAGGWVKNFLPKVEQKRFKICRQILHWLEIEDGSNWRDMPVFMWGFGPRPEDFVYGFPSLDGKSIKVATESFLETNHPDQIMREVFQSEQEAFWNEKISGRIKGLTGKIIRSEVCFYTVTEDARFVIEPHSTLAQVTMVSACSGHGFKHSAALGEYLADKMMGNTLSVPDFM